MKRFSAQRLTTRLILSHLLVGVVGIGLITLVAYNFILQGGRRMIEDELTDLALNTSNSLENPFLNLSQSQDFIPVVRQVLQTTIAHKNLIDYVVFARDGSALLTSQSTPAPSRIAQVAPQVQRSLEGKTIHFSSKDPQQGDVFYTIVPVSHLDMVYGALMLTIPYEPNLGTTRQSLLTMLAVAWLVLAAVGLGAYLVAQSFNRPIRNLTQMAERMSAGDFRSRAELAGPAELVQLALSLNQMAAQLQDNLDGMRAFVANASHELRTPLTAMRLNTEALQGGALEDPAVSRRFLAQLEDEIDLMSRTVNDLLDLSRIESNRNLPMTVEIDLKALVEETVQLWNNRTAQARLTLRYNNPVEAAVILGDEDQLRRLLNNLLDNAVKNTPEGGWVEINLLRLGDKTIRLEVGDSGRGIAAEHLPRLFERFYRIESSNAQKRTMGTGLGLAIVKSIVEAHQGRIGVSSVVGKGSTFWMEFKPVTAPNQNKN